MDKVRILIVDDDVHLSQLVAIMLEKTRLYTTAVENRPHQALRRASNFKPELVLLDVDMPGTDGAEVARQFRQHPPLHDVPIIFFTSLISPGDANETMIIRGGERFLPKPVDAAVLIRSIESVLCEAATASP
jgi:two-component system OmpR family response regulator